MAEFADGGILHDGGRAWAEPETGTECYIPIAFDAERADRNARILAEALERSRDKD
ncbi:hypothetical protein [Mycetocola miduiensis]|uniref:Uncharacterized protein n=1 Tax=Mycetocola miduiensis TaxID=995034 RepID=A0A1I5AUY1_9MICO|nr:hypothetical protein [Mycetocola miduiensis]SFN66235.1 hypothetical protein SAMN05216219_1555 [Mycetocola miduiensis]